MITSSLLWQPSSVTLIVSLALQASFFLISYVKKTNLLRELSYGLSFITIVWWLALRLAPLNSLSAALVAMITLWGLWHTIQAYTQLLLLPNESTATVSNPKSFSWGMFWIQRALSIWLVLLPATQAISNNYPPLFTPWQWTGLAIWGLGMLLKFKKTGAPVAKMGEACCWWGIFFMVMPELQGWKWISIGGPLYSLLPYLRRNSFQR